MPKGFTAVDERGFRTHDRDGHRIAWFAPDRRAPGQWQSVMPIGRCTAGDWWHQTGGNALTGGAEPMHGGTFDVSLYLHRQTGEEGETEVTLHIGCAGGHVARRWGGAAAFGEPRSADELVALRDRLVGEGWRFTWREAGRHESGEWKLDVWCPRCIAEWQALEAELGQLQAAE